MMWVCVCVHLSVYYRTTWKTYKPMDAHMQTPLQAQHFVRISCRGSAYLTHSSVGSGHRHGRFVAASSSWLHHSRSMQLSLGCCWFHGNFGKAFEISEASCSKGNTSTHQSTQEISYTKHAYVHTWTRDAGIGWCIMLHRCTSITLHILVWRSSIPSIVANCALDAGAVGATFRPFLFLAILFISNKAVLLPLPCYWSLSWVVCGPKTCTALLHSNWE